MGNCWPKQVDYLHSRKTKTSVHNGTRAIKNGNIDSPSPVAGSGGAGGGGGGAAPPPHGESIENRTANLKIFSLEELQSATRDFRVDMMLGEGGFGRVFRGYIDEKTYSPSKVGVGMPVAVKKSSPDSEQGLKEWQAEVNFLGRFRHPNLVKLLGYCWDDRNFLLVYEYMPRGSLESHLFRKGAAEPIPWDTRVKIAIGAARGLAFLHSTGGKQVIYRDFKASNILLDGEFNAKLSDFGLAKLGPLDGSSHVTTQVVGTYGYAAPEYMATGHLYVKSDVYSFGVVLLELITGLRVLDPNRPNGQGNLVEWARPFLPNKKKLRKIIDPGLEDQYSSKGAYKMAELILVCLKPDPKHRPCMDEVLAALEQISVIKMKPKKLEANSNKDRGYCRPFSPLHNHHRHGGVMGNMVISPRHNHHEHGIARGNMVGPLSHNTLNVGRR